MSRDCHTCEYWATHLAPENPEVRAAGYHPCHHPTENVRIVRGEKLYDFTRPDDDKTCAVHKLKAGAA